MSRINGFPLLTPEVEYVDMHLSHLPQTVLFGFFGRIDLAVVKATDITRDGRVFLTTSIGASPTYLQYADRVVIEINRRHSPRLCEMADILVLPPPPHRTPIPIFEPLGRAGLPYARVDPRKVIGIVEKARPGHIRHDLAACFELHRNLIATGRMLPRAETPAPAGGLRPT